MDKFIENLQIEIDADDGLKSKRRLLIIVSLVLLAIQFSGAKIIEANTFILKLDFTNQNGLALLLCMSVVFLLIRYYGYARKYHQALYELWSTDLMNDPIIETRHEPSGDRNGLLHEYYPPKSSIEDAFKGAASHYSASYKNSGFFKRQFRHDVTWENSPEAEAYEINIFTELKFKQYLQILALEVKHKVLGFFNYRENLDILAPYILGVFSISTFIFHTEFQTLIIYVLGN